MSTFTGIEITSTLHTVGKKYEKEGEVEEEEDHDASEEYSSEDDYRSVEEDRNESDDENDEREDFESHFVQRYIADVVLIVLYHISLHRAAWV